MKSRNQDFKAAPAWSISCQEAFSQEVTRILGGEDGLPDDWYKTAEKLRKPAETVLE